MKDLLTNLNNSNQATDEIYQYFGFKETVETSINDSTEYWWGVHEDTLYFAKSLSDLENLTNHYEYGFDERFDRDDFTAFLYDYQDGGSWCFAIFDTKKKVELNIEE